MTPRNFTPPPPRIIAWRKNMLIAVIFLLFAGLVVGGPLRIGYFAAVAKEESKIRHNYKKILFAHRGGIVDTAGVPLAMSADVYEVRADMAELAGNEDRRRRLNELTPELAQILQTSEDELHRKLEGNGRAVLLSRKLPAAAGSKLFDFRDRHKSELYGLRIEYKSKRYYPQREFAASVVGYVNHENRGKTGVEFARQKELREEHGENRGVRARTGARIDSFLSRPPRDGKDITLAIDSRLQFFAYEALQNAALQYDARAGAAAVMDVRTGGIVAMASYPEANPNNLRAGEVVKNRALSDQMEPGSLVKPFIAALALQAGKTSAEEVFPTHRLTVIGGVAVKPDKNKEPLDLAGVLKNSSNIGAVILGWRLGREPVWRFYQQLGFGQKILRMPGEAAGSLRPASEWHDSELVTHAYGYNLSTTLLQLLSGYSVFAADGWRIVPDLDKSTTPPFRERILDAHVARQVRTMLEQVTQPDGTAPSAAISGYRVAGKTGTAKLEKPEGGYYDDDYRAFFVGIAPASNPRYIAAVMIDRPRHNGRGVGGGRAAAPVFREIMRRALRLNAVPPDAPVGNV